MTKEEFLQLANYLQRMEKLMTAVVTLMNTVDPATLTSEDDLTSAAPAINPQQNQGTPNPITAQGPAIQIPEDQKKKVVITNPVLRDLVKDIKEKQKEEEEELAAASGIITRNAPYEVEITYIDRTDSLQPMAKVVDTKHGYYNFIPVSIEEAKAIQDLLDSNQPAGIELTQAELDNINDKWVPVQTQQEV